MMALYQSCKMVVKIHDLTMRAFGVTSRTWLQQLIYRRRDRVLISLGVLLLLASIVLSIFGFGKFWVPETWINQLSLL